MKGDSPETALKNQHCCRPAAGLPPVLGEVQEPISHTRNRTQKKKKQHPVPQGINNAPPLSHRSRGGEEEEEEEDVRSPLQPRHDSNLLLCGKPGALTALAWLVLLAGRRGSGLLWGNRCAVRCCRVPALCRCAQHQVQLLFRLVPIQPPSSAAPRSLPHCFPRKLALKTHPKPPCPSTAGDCYWPQLPPSCLITSIWGCGKK